jgi:hypothetical protein
MMAAIGLLLDLFHESNSPQSLYSAEAFRVALASQFAVLAIGLIGLLRSAKRTAQSEVQLV